jgi:hypothetical protein
MEKTESPEGVLICPKCNKGFNEKATPPFLPINCDCSAKFSYIKCLHCTGNIYLFDIYIDGITISCPYNDCKKQFAYNKCNQCSNIVPIPNKCLEATKYTCNNCKKDSIRMICPNIDCGTIIKLNPNSTIKEGGIVECPKCKNKAQKLNCINCSRRLVWNINKDDTTSSQYLEGQKVICPYDTCGKSFNKLYCPFCNTANEFDGKKEIGTKIVCSNIECKKSFVKVMCPKCRTIGIYKNVSLVEGVKITCAEEKCKAIFCYINCSECKRINFWFNENYFLGQPVICAYNDCKKKFNKVNCPHCNRYNIFTDYFFGKNYKCIYQDCNLEFSRLVCPGCVNSLFIKGKRNEGSIATCEICKISFRNMRCPHCNQTFVDKGGNYKFGQTIICPYNNCGRRFNQLYCIHCTRIMNFKLNNFVEGQIINCPYDECKKEFIYGHCSCCNRVLQVNSPVKALNGVEFQCCYDSCKKKMIFGGIEKTVFNGIILKVDQGKTFSFTNPTKDPIEVRLLKSLPQMYFYFHSMKDHHGLGLKEELATTNNGIIYLMFRLYYLSYLSKGVCVCTLWA